MDWHYIARYHKLTHRYLFHLRNGDRNPTSWQYLQADAELNSELAQTAQRLCGLENKDWFIQQSGSFMYQGCKHYASLVLYTTDIDWLVSLRLIDADSIIFNYLVKIEYIVEQQN